MMLNETWYRNTNLTNDQFLTKNFSLSAKICHLHPQKFLMTFLVIDHKFLNSPCFRKILHSPSFLFRTLPAQCSISTLPHYLQRLQAKKLYQCIMYYKMYLPP